MVSIFWRHTNLVANFGLCLLLIKMALKESNLFNFPFQPYSIQVDLMNKIYQILEEKKIGLLSSPTGSGKSLSIICSSLYFLQKLFKDGEETVLEKMKQLNEQLSQLEIELNDCADSWIELHSKKQKIGAEALEVDKAVKNYQQFNQRSEQLKQKYQQKFDSDKGWNHFTQIQAKKKFKKGSMFSKSYLTTKILINGNLI